MAVTKKAMKDLAGAAEQLLSELGYKHVPELTYTADFSRNKTTCILIRGTKRVRERLVGALEEIQEDLMMNGKDSQYWDAGKY